VHGDVYERLREIPPDDLQSTPRTGWAAAIRDRNRVISKPQYNGARVC
jgi:hypothetical protein